MKSSDKTLFVTIFSFGVFLYLLLGLMAGRAGYGPLTFMFGILTIYGFFNTRKLWSIAKAINSHPEMQNAKYKHEWDGSAIAVNDANRTVFLANGFKIKTYSFSDVRSWRYNLETGGKWIGGALFERWFRNAEVSAKNVARSGFFVTVRDVENPEWRIGFRMNDQTESQLKKWMEIMQQEINEG